MRAAIALALTLAACAHPIPLVEQRMLADVAKDFRSFYPAAADPDLSRDAALLRPRFGLPAIVRAGDAIAIDLLDRGDPPGDGAAPRAYLVAPGTDEASALACARGTAVPGCFPLALDEEERADIGPGIARVRYLARPAAAPPPRDYDLLIADDFDALARAPRAVWLRPYDPAAPRALRVVQMSDLHIGKGDPKLIEEHLAETIRAVNALAPDLVVVTGDITNLGQDPKLAPRAREILLGVDAPVVAVIGNHDLGLNAQAVTRDGYGAPWANFARSFHPWLYFRFTLGGWDFVGFDTGPSLLSPRVLVRGLSPETLDELRAALSDAARDHRRGVVLMSHAPTRACLSDRTDPARDSGFGRMAAGAHELEAAMLAATSSGLRVIHLAGHTHWSDLFADQGGRFVRLAGATGGDEQSPDSPALLVTTQSASHPGLFTKESAHGFGFAKLELDGGRPRVTFERLHTDLTPPPPPPDQMVRTFDDSAGALF